MKRIYIDPGHGEGVKGQRDPGAVGPTGLTENEITFDVAKRLGHLLRAQGMETMGDMLHALQDTENLNEAINVANAAHVDLFVSLHCNSAAAPSAHGVEVWYSKDAAAEHTAKCVLARITIDIAKGFGKWLKGRRLPLTSRGTKPGTFAVLRRTHMPAILVEMAFISNLAEEQWLRDANVRQQFAQSIADGIIASYR